MINHSFTVMTGRLYKSGVGLRGQRGSTLLVGLIMLILLTLMAISAMNATTSSIQIVGNAQFREEANAAAQQAIEGVISNNFTTNPVASVATVTIGAASYTVQVEKPACTSSAAVTNGELDPIAIVADRNCAGSSQRGGGPFDASGKLVSSTPSWCLKQKWDIRATVNDANTGANIALHQGVSIRVPIGTTCL